jgi:DNA-binding LacI/PurR family transcriptional regulator
LLTTGSQMVSGEQQAIESMLEQRVDGMVLVSPRLSTAELRAFNAIVPVVVIGRVVRGGAIDSVSNDERHGARLVVEHLHSLGHRCIAHVDGGAGAGARARRRGYEGAMRTLGLEPDVIAGDYTERAGVAAAEDLLRRTRLPTAVFGANDLVAAGALDAFESAGRRVPDDLSIVGYDNTFLARLHHVSLTSVDQHTSKIGRIAMELLLERLDGARARPVTRLVTPSLKVRGTSGPVPPG